MVQRSCQIIMNKYEKNLHTLKPLTINQTIRNVFGHRLFYEINVSDVYNTLASGMQTSEAKSLNLYERVYTHIMVAVEVLYFAA